MEELIARNFINMCAILLLGYMIQRNDLFDEDMRKDYSYVVGAVAISILAEMLSVIFVAPNSLHRLINTLSLMIGFGVSPVIPLLMMDAFASEHSGSRWPIMLPGLVNLLLVVLSPIYGLIFYVSPPNVYGRGPFFPLYVFAYLFGIAVFLVAALRTREVYQSGSKVIVIGLIVITLLGTTVQVVVPHVFLSWSTITIVMILGYTYHNDLLDKHDVVTKLFNRRTYEKHLLRLQSEGRGWIVLFDVDEFKFVNDSFGHHYGDFALQFIARMVRESYTTIGCGYRIGGDEFCVLSTSADEREIQEANDRFMASVRRARNEDPRIPCVSLGYALYDGSRGLSETVEAADQELFSYKRAHKRHKAHT